MSTPFGFEVQFHDADPYDDDSQAGWSVSLPHQCDSWDIVGDGWLSGEPQDKAVAEFERFIAEAQQALAALREGRKFRAGEA